MKITKPPQFNLAASHKSIIGQIIKGTTLIITNTTNEYVHWDKLRHLIPPKNFNSIEEYWFFIKYSRIQQYKQLPFTEKFVYILTDTIQQKIHEIDSRMHGSIEAKNLNHNKNRYIMRSLIEEAISSAQLEGASTTRKVAKNMLETKRSPQDYSEKMIYNNYQAIKFIDNHKNDDLTPSLVLELHNIVTQNTIENLNDTGSLRINNNIEVMDNVTNKTLHTPPSFETLPHRLKILCAFANSNTPDYFIHPIIRAIIVHFALAFDHPFTDGNGRTARALFYWVALKNNYWLFQYITISTYIKEAQAQYGKSFLKVESDEFDLTYFITSQLQFIDQAINGLFNYVDKKQNKQQYALRLLNNYLSAGKINGRQAMLLAHALKHSGEVYTFESHKITHNIGYKAAREDLLTLAIFNLLQQSKIGRAFVFIAPNDLEQRIKNYHGE